MPGSVRLALLLLPLLLMLLPVRSPGVAGAAITDPRLLLHVEPPDCQLTINCIYQPPHVSLAGPGPVTVHLLVQDMGEEFPTGGSITGLQTAFAWDEWTLLSSSWSCLPGQITSRAPTGSGAGLGTLTTVFDAITVGTTAVVGWMQMEATAGVLRQVDSNEPMGTHVLDGNLEPVAVPELSRGLVRVEGPGMAPCDRGCQDPLSVTCTTNTLEEPDVHLIGSRISAPALGDVDSDQRLDIVVSADGWLTVLKGLGYGWFEEPSFGPSGVGTPYLEDRNGDGHLDVVARGAADTFGIWPGVGDGTFGAPTLYPAGGLGDVIFGHVNDDSITDVIGMVADGIGVLLGDASGGFQPIVQQSLGTTIHKFDAGDVNGDGLADLAVIVDEGFDFQGRIYAGIGDGTFDLGTPLTEFWLQETRGIKLSDFTGDGNLDLMWITYVNNDGRTYVETSVGQGDGMFVPVFGSVEITGCGFLSGVADLNGDGAPDLIATGGGNCTSHAYCGYGAALEIKAGDGAGDFGSRLLHCFYGLGRWARVTVGDVDGDEALDVVASADPAVVVYRAAPRIAVDSAPPPARPTRMRVRPNPLRSFAEILVELDRPATAASLTIYDAAGRHVRTLASGVRLGAGRHRWSWDAADGSGRRVAAGVYMARLGAGGTQIADKLLVVR